MMTLGRMLFFRDNDRFFECEDQSGLFAKTDDGTVVEIGTEIVRPKKPTDRNIAKIWQELSKRLGDVEIGTRKFSLYVGYPQSGKSFYQFCALWYGTFVLKKQVVHLLDNRTPSLLQNLTRDHLDFAETILGICKRLNIAAYYNYIFDYIPQTRASLDLAAKLDVRCTSRAYPVLVSIGNVTQLNTMVENSVGENMCFIVDEADTFVKSVTASPESEIEKIIHPLFELPSTSVYFFTATPFANLNRPGQVFDYIKVLKPKSSYRGLDSPKIRKNLLGPSVYREVAQRTDLNGFPNVTLVNVTHDTAKMLRLSKQIRLQVPDSVIFVWNSKSDNFTYNGTVHRNITQLFNSIANSKETRPVFIVAGRMAGRAISFRSSKNSANQAILTNFIYDPSKTSHEANLVQSMRILGNYDESYPDIDMYCSPEVLCAVENAFRNIQAMMTPLKTGKETRSSIEDALTQRTKNRGFDRANVDDTVVGRRNDFEYRTPEELLRMLKTQMDVTKFEILTEKVGTVKLTQTFQYGRDNPKVYAEIKKTLTRPEENLHVAWHTARYAELFSLAHRMNHVHYQRCAFTVGDPSAEGPQTDVPYVKWKTEWRDVAGCTDPDTVYMYQTTRKTWKGFVPNEEFRTIKRIQHC